MADASTQTDILPDQSATRMSEDEDSDPHYVSSSSEYSPSDAMSESSDSFHADNNPPEPADVRQIYFVFWTALLELFTLCCCTHCASKNIVSHRKEIGTMIIVKFSCKDCNADFLWRSQPYYGGIPAGNILMSSSVLFAGATITKFLRVLKHMGVAAISARTFFRHQSQILCDALKQVWNDRQTWMLCGLQLNANVVCGGDGRADTPGHSAKYGTYTLIELTEKAVIDIQIVQVYVTKKTSIFVNICLY